MADADAPEPNVVEALIIEVDDPETNQADTNVADSSFTIDSGCNYHMCKDRKWLTDYSPFDEYRQVRLAGSRTLTAKGRGSVKLSVTRNGEIHMLLLNNVLYVPNLRRNLVSVSKLVEDGVDIDISTDAFILRQNGSELIAGQVNGLYVLEADDPVEANAVSGTRQVSLKSAHSTFAHINIETLRKMLKKEGFEIVNDFVTCSFCTRAKMHRSSYRSRPVGATSPKIGHIFSDVCSLNTPSFGKANHFITFTDDRTKFRKVYFIKTKDEVSECI